MKRLLCILSGMNAGGAETFLMKIYRQMDKTRYQLDFCINEPEHCFYEDEIEALGGEIHRIPAKSTDVFEYGKALKKIIRDNHYEYVLRITSNAAGFLDLKIAKEAGAKVCVARSSNSSDGGSKKMLLVHKISQLLLEKYVDVKIAPSQLAAGYTFCKAQDVQIIHNAIDLDVFCYSEEGRRQVRAEYGLSYSDVVVGHVGRFMPQKNHTFLLDIFAELYKRNADYKLLLIGKGELERQLREKTAALGLEDAVIFGGVRSDIPKVLSAMDVFVFPSFYEGMPNAVIEAQATGLPCILADTITQEADITGLLRYLPLGDSVKWAVAVERRIQQGRVNTMHAFREHKYDIESQTKLFIQLIFEKA